MLSGKILSFSQIPLSIADLKQTPGWAIITTETRRMILATEAQDLAFEAIITNNGPGYN